MVTNGVTVGLAKTEVHPVGDDDQLYVFPITAVAPICVLELRLISLLAPAIAAGKGFTLTTITFEATAFVQSIMAVTRARRLNQVAAVKDPGA